MSEHNKSTVAVVTLVVGLIIGGVFGYSMSGDKTKNMDSATTDSMEMTSDTDGVTVGGAKMVSSKDIVDNAANADNVTTVVDLVKQAELVETLKSTGPFTVFGPSNAAFEAVPKDVLDKVAGDKELLKTVLTYHVLQGTYTTADLRALASEGKSVKTVQGAKLTFKVVDGDVVVVDETDQQVEIETADIISSNGVTHVIKNVLLPVDPSTL